jgi:hypothetical protein
MFQSVAGAIIVLFLGEGILFHAPTEAQTNRYQLREKVWTSKTGSVVMTGIETRKIKKPFDGKRQVDIAFDVHISERGYSGPAGQKWADAELASLREPDHGFMDDQDRLSLSDGVALDAFPIFGAKPVEVGHSWQLTIEGHRCLYTLEKIEKGIATITTESKRRVAQGEAKRKGTWKVEVESGRLMSWNMHSEAQFMSGTKETVDSSGELEP